MRILKANPKTRRGDSSLLPGVGALAFLAAMLGAPHVGAQVEQHFDLEYEVSPAVASCPNDAEFRGAVAQRLGYDPYQSGQPPRVEVRIRDTESGLQGTIEWVTKGEQRLGERSFSSPHRDCHDMALSMAFVLAVQAQMMAMEPGDNHAVSSDARGDSPTVSATEPPPPIERMSERNRHPTPADAHPAPPFPTRVRTEWSVEGRGGLAIGFGLARHPVGIGKAVIALQSRRFGVELGADMVPPSTTRFQTGDEFRQDLVLGTLAFCGSQQAIAACTVGKLGRIRVDGQSIDHPRSSAGLFAQSGIRLQYSLKLHDHLALVSHLEGLYLITPWTIEVNRVAVWSVPRFSANTGLAVAARFP